MLENQKQSHLLSTDTTALPLILLYLPTLNAYIFIYTSPNYLLFFFKQRTCHTKDTYQNVIELKSTTKIMHKHKLPSKKNKVLHIGKWKISKFLRHNILINMTGHLSIFHVDIHILKNSLEFQQNIRFHIISHLQWVKTLRTFHLLNEKTKLSFGHIFWSWNIQIRVSKIMIFDI